MYNFASIPIEDFFFTQRSLKCTLSFFQLWQKYNKKHCMRPLAIFISKANKDRVHFVELLSERTFNGYESIFVHHKKLVFQSSVIFRPSPPQSVRPAKFNLIWIEWNSHDSWTIFQLFWPCISAFKLKWSLDWGWSLAMP